MILIFGKKNCKSCVDYKEKLDKEGKEYKFFDLDTVDGLTEAAERSIINQCEKRLPVILGEN